VYCGPPTVKTITTSTDNANITTTTTITSLGNSVCTRVCSKGFKANGSSSIACQDGITDPNVDLNPCLDINECLNSTVSGCGTVACYNTAGSFTCLCPNGKAFNKTSHACATYKCAKKSACGSLESSYNITYFLDTSRLASLNTTLMNVSRAIGLQMGLAVVTVNNSWASTVIQLTIKSVSGGTTPQWSWDKIKTAFNDPNSILRVGFPDLSSLHQLNDPAFLIPVYHYNALWGLVPIILFTALCAFWRPIFACIKKQRAQKEFDADATQPVLGEVPPEPSP